MKLLEDVTDAIAQAGGPWRLLLSPGVWKLVDVPDPCDGITNLQAVLNAAGRALDRAGKAVPVPLDFWAGLDGGRLAWLQARAGRVSCRSGRTVFALTLPGEDCDGFPVACCCD